MKSRNQSSACQMVISITYQFAKHTGIHRSLHGSPTTGLEVPDACATHAEKPWAGARQMYMCRDPKVSATHMEIASTRCHWKASTDPDSVVLAVVPIESSNAMHRVPQHAVHALIALSTAIGTPSDIPNAGGHPMRLCLTCYVSTLYEYIAHRDVCHRRPKMTLLQRAQAPRLDYPYPTPPVASLSLS